MIIPNAGSGLLLQTMLYLANQTAKDVESLNEYKKNDINDVRCYGVYGCFPIDGLWTTNTRQVSSLPENPSQINTRFAVFNQGDYESPKFIDLNDPDRVKSIGINPYGKIFVLAHGYLESGDRPWLKEMTKALLNKKENSGDSVIVIDWGGGSSPPYVQAAANIRLVGAITAHVIHLIYEELSLPNLANVHMIGHSLGAHLCGYTGYTLQRDFGIKLGRISALDPAEPLFADTDPIVRLDKSDAQFIDVMHTDAHLFMRGGLGMTKPIGHVDFYPNGGYNNPGCRATFEEYMNKDKKSFFWSMQKFLGCNHIRSYEYYLESIQPKCPFKGITCDSYESFQDGKCAQCGKNGNLCLNFGYDSYSSYRYLVENSAICDDKPVIAYLMTNSQSPFCQVHYKVTVKISSSEESRLHGGEIGTLTLKFQNSHKAETQKIPFTEEPKLYEPGLEYVAVVPGKDIKEPEFATLYWEYKTNLLNPLTWRIVETPRIYIDHIIVENIEYGTRIQLCPKFGEALVSGSSNSLAEHFCY